MGKLDVHVLGPVEVIAHGQVLPLGRGTVTDLLAALAVSPNRVLPAQVLAETVWHERLPEHPRAALQTAVARLRRLVGDGFIETLPSGYRFRAETSSLDLLRFEQLVAAADRQQAPADALTALTGALALWRGHPLQNVGSPTLLDGAAARLTQLYLAACEKWARLCLLTGQPETAAARLATLITAHPFRERMAELLMLAHYRSGRQADAIAAFETLRHTLSEELGIDPGEAVRELHLRILRADPSLIGNPGSGDGTQQAAADPLWAAPWPASPPRVVPRQLPRTMPDFCGRETEGNELTELLGSTASAPGEAPVAVIVGKGGIGKTALAVQVAHRLAAVYRDGQLFASLRGAGQEQMSPEYVLADFLEALGVNRAAVPRTLESRVAMFRSLAAGRRLLVVLDDAASESQLEPLLPASSSCGVLITSRSRLTGLPGSRLVSLHGLEYAYAIELLTAIVGLDRATAEEDAARELVSQCGGLPLALRIVGARLAAKPHWPLAKLAARLADERRRLSELAHGDLNVRARFYSSYERVDGTAQEMLRRLSLLDVPDFPSRAGAAVLGCGLAEAEDICERLVDAQLLDLAGSLPDDEIRYGFHDLVRAFARDLALVTKPGGARYANHHGRSAPGQRELRLDPAGRPSWARGPVITVQAARPGCTRRTAGSPG
jgi:DNA-binding SARP family transcriptional activator